MGRTAYGLGSDGRWQGVRAPSSILSRSSIEEHPLPASQLAGGSPFVNNPIYEDAATASLPGDFTENSSPILTVKPQGEITFPFHR